MTADFDSLEDKIINVFIYDSASPYCFCSLFQWRFFTELSAAIFLVDISPLSQLHHVVELDCSHNQLTACLQLDPHPLNLRRADFSFNAITEIPDLTKFTCLETLILDSKSCYTLRCLTNLLSLRVVRTVKARTYMGSSFSQWPFRMTNNEHHSALIQHKIKLYICLTTIGTSLKTRRGINNVIHTK